MISALKIDKFLHSVAIKKYIYFTLCIITFLISNIKNVNAEEFLDAILATINNTPITVTDVNQRYGKNYSFNDFNTNYSAKKLLDKVILDTIVSLEAKKKRLDVSEGEIQQYISEVASKNSMTVEEFQEALKSRNITFSAYKEQVKSDILKSKIASSVIQTRTSITEKQVDEYLKKINENKLLDSKISLSQICILKEGKTEAQALKTLKTVLEKLDNDSFEDVAKKYSETSDSENGGFLGEFELIDLSSDIFGAVSSLKQGEVSRIVNMGNAYYLFKVNQRDIQSAPSESERQDARKKLENDNIQDSVDDYFSKEIYKNYSIEKKINE